MERVSKLIARAGIASRRAAEDLITSGEVSVNGHYVSEPGVKADPKRDKVVVSGRPLIMSEIKARQSYRAPQTQERDDDARQTRR